MTIASKCQVCHEPITRKLPFCDLSPLEIRLPEDMRICFWCRRDLYEYFSKSIEIDEAQITQWLSFCLAVMARRAAQSLPLRRCEVGDGRGRCRLWAMQEINQLWVCGHHASDRFASAPRHYLDWRCQRLFPARPGSILILPPRAKAPRDAATHPKGSDQRGSNNGNASLTEDDVRTIRQMIKAGCYNTTIARQFGVTHSMISLIRRGKTWKHVE